MLYKSGWEEQRCKKKTNQPHLTVQWKDRRTQRQARFSVIYVAGVTRGSREGTPWIQLQLLTATWEGILPESGLCTLTPN